MQRRKISVGHALIGHVPPAISPGILGESRAPALKVHQNISPPHLTPPEPGTMLSKRRKVSHDAAAVKAPSTKVTKTKSKAPPAPAPKEPPAPAPGSDDDDEDEQEDADEGEGEDESSTLDNVPGEGNGEPAPKSFQDLVCDTQYMFSTSPMMVADSPRASSTPSATPATSSDTRGRRPSRSRQSPLPCKTAT